MSEEKSRDSHYTWADMAVLFVAPYGQVTDESQRFFEKMEDRGVANLLYAPAEAFKKDRTRVVSQEFYAAFRREDADGEAYIAPTIEEFDFVEFAGGDEEKAAADKSRLMAEYAEWYNDLSERSKSRFPEVPYVWIVRAQVFSSSEDVLREVHRISSNMAEAHPLEFKVGSGRIEYRIPKCTGSFSLVEEHDSE